MGVMLLYRELKDYKGELSTTNYPINSFEKLYAFKRSRCKKVAEIRIN